jgi:hypothetical protein
MHYEYMSQNKNRLFILHYMAHFAKEVKIEPNLGSLQVVPESINNRLPPLGSFLYQTLHFTELQALRQAVLHTSRQ